MKEIFNSVEVLSSVCILRTCCLKFSAELVEIVNNNISTCFIWPFFCASDLSVFLDALHLLSAQGYKLKHAYGWRLGKDLKCRLVTNWNKDN